MPPLTRISSANVVFQDVGKLLGIACRCVETKAELIPRLVTGVVKEAQRRKMQVVTPVTENPLPR